MSNFRKHLNIIESNKDNNFSFTKNGKICWLWNNDEIKDDYSVKDPEYSQDKYNNIPASYISDKKVTDKKEIR